MDEPLKRRLRTVPAWWADAKLGIFVHWTPASVPGFAPTDSAIGEALVDGDPAGLAAAPYSEWYENALRFPDSPTAAHHRATYGDRPYAAFAEDFVAGLDGWDPDEWAHRFAATGARYVVLVTKHHDGWCLWPSAVANPRRPGWFSERDLVGELAEAVRGQGMRFGVYYSGGLDWTWEEWPIRTLGDAAAACPRGDYAAYAEAQVRELIRRYRPSVLWNDIGWPTGQKALNQLFTDYFAAVPDGVVNDRWMAQLPGPPVLRWSAPRKLVDTYIARQMRSAGGLVPPAPRFYQYRTPEYARFDDVQRTPWEMVRGMDHGFGYNRTSTESDFLTRDDLLRSLADVAAKGGNLLLNVGPRGEDAAIPDEQLARLDWLAEWMGAAAPALRGTRPWVRPADRSAEGHEVRYTATGDRVWALAWTEGTDPAPTTLTLPFASTATTEVSTFAGVALAFADARDGLRISLPDAPDPHVLAVALDRARPLPT